MPLLRTIALDSASLIHSTKSERCRGESSETTMNVMSERTMTNSARPNLDASLAEAYENAPYPWNPRLQQSHIMQNLATAPYISRIRANYLSI